MDAELTLLAGTAAGALVTAMTTDAWQGTRDAFARMLHRTNPERYAAVDQRLDDDARLVREDPSPPQKSEVAERMWEALFSELLHTTPACAADLAAITKDATPQTGGIRIVQNVISQTGNAYGSLYGHVHHHEYPSAVLPPLLAPPAAADPAESDGRRP